MLQNVLIVSPNFPPVNTPDHQRIRMSLPYFKEFGWNPTVLALKPTIRKYTDRERLDPLLSATVPSNVEVIRTGALPGIPLRRYSEALLSLRVLPAMLRAGGRLLKVARFKLVYFSTTLFPVMSLGPVWKKRYGIPFVVDYQDPWINDYYKDKKPSDIPGGHFRYAISQKLGEKLEANTMGAVDHVISVSSAYSRTLLNRYSGLREDQFTVLPFGGALLDFETVNSMNVKQSVFDPADGLRHFVYVGRGGPDLKFSLSILFEAMRALRNQEARLFDKVIFHFVGTSYAETGKSSNSIEPVAREFGVSDIVEEQRQRIPYFESLKLLSDSDGILLPGSDDPGYTASKVYPCIIAARPTLAIFNSASSVVQILKECQTGKVATFNGSGKTKVIEEVIIHLRWLLSLPRGYRPSIDWNSFAPYSARHVTQRQCEIFDRCVATSGDGCNA